MAQVGPILTGDQYITILAGCIVGVCGGAYDIDKKEEIVEDALELADEVVRQLKGREHEE